MDYNFRRHRIDKISKDKIISELKKAAKFYNYTEFTGDDFAKVADISTHTVVREFKGWNNALVFLVNLLREESITLKPRRKGYFEDAELFAEMEKIWKQLGHRPSPIEWKLSKPKFSSTTYMRYFNGWQNACLKFIEYKMGNEIVSNVEQKNNESVTNKKTDISKGYITRSIPLGLRIRVLSRDNYRCVKCGRSPATDFGIKLHLDHKIPFSQNGKSTEENLQTLCQDCNIGKGDKIL